MRTPAITQQMQLLQRSENNNQGCRLMAAVQTHTHPLKLQASSHVDTNKSKKKNNGCVPIRPQHEAICFQTSQPIPVSPSQSALNQVFEGKRIITIDASKRDSWSPAEHSSLNGSSVSMTREHISPASTLAEEQHIYRSL